MTEKILIKRIRKAQTQSGKTVAHLFSNSIQRYPELVLFELADLLTVGIQPETLTPDDQPARFWAHFEVSEKTNSKGNPYRNVLYLEPAQTQAAQNAETDDLLTELKAIRAQLDAIHAILTDHQLQPAPAIGAQDPHVEHAREIEKAGTALLAPDPEKLHKQADEETDYAPTPNHDALTKFYDLAAQASTDTNMPLTDATAILDAVAGDHGFELALQCLQAEMQRPRDKKYQHRQQIIARIKELAAEPLVTNGLVENPLTPGWQWIKSRDELIDLGRALRAALDDNAPN